MAPDSLPSQAESRSGGRARTLKELLEQISITDRTRSSAWPFEVVHWETNKSFPNFSDLGFVLVFAFRPDSVRDAKSAYESGQASGSLECPPLLMDGYSGTCCRNRYRARCSLPATSATVTTVSCFSGWKGSSGYLAGCAVALAGVEIPIWSACSALLDPRTRTPSSRMPSR